MESDVVGTRCLHCHQALASGWAFCIYCGADNRPPEKRPKIRPHPHEYYGEGDRCAVCGRKSSDSGVA